MRKFALTLTALVAVICTSGCATQPYMARQNLTKRVGDATVRYGTTAAVGGGVGYGVYKATKNPLIGAAAGVGASALTLGIFKNGDKRANEAYQAGVVVGQEEARSEILKEKWKREAVYGLPPEGSVAKPSTVRRVWVPEREVNGVKYAAGYQTVEAYR